LASWFELKQRHNIRGMMRKWYIELCKVVCIQDDENDAESDDEGDSVVEALAIEDIALEPEHDSDDDEAIVWAEADEPLEDAAGADMAERASQVSETDSEPLEDPRHRRRAALLDQAVPTAGPLD
ncbi:hypothetical protein BGZ70_006854, partial [Mortierella alpina]